MIKILSISNDHSTNAVIDWLEYKNANWSRINAEDIENKLSFSSFQKFYNNDLPKVVWFRKWQKGINKIDENECDLTSNIGKEFDEISKFIFNVFSESKWLNHPNNLQIDKLYQLLQAQKSGLAIPNTELVCKKEELSRFKEKYKFIITKPLAAVIHKIIENKSYLNYTRNINNDEIEKLEDSFYPTLVQEEIKKEFEIRSFYLEGDFYSMAIFSQNDEQTSLDFRHYNFDKPNRTVTFQIPKLIENKLESLMKKLQINCGSIDLIKDINGNYVFLEVNPLGQLGMVSSPCNYFLEEKIAQHLINLTNEKDYKDKSSAKFSEFKRN